MDDEQQASSSVRLELILKFEISIPDESPCEACGANVSLHLGSCPDCGANTYRLTLATFYADFERFKMMDARYGGLVIGRAGPEDDIPMFICREGGIYTLVGLMQGGEYIMSRAATWKYRERLSSINSEKGDAGVVRFDLTPASSVINTNFMPPYAGLWITEGQFIVNRYATMIHFDELERLNAEANYEFAKSLVDEMEISASTR